LSRKGKVLVFESPDVYPYFENSMWTLPGHGAMYWSCGTVKGSYISDDGERVVLRNWCYKKSCPICFRKWAGKRARIAAARVYALKRAEGNNHLSHWVVSLPSSLGDGVFADIEVYRKVKGKIISRFRKVGVSGLIIFHPFRWEAEYWKKGPHFHLIVNSNFVNFLDLSRGSGFIFKNIRTVECDVDSIFSLVQYELSHSGVCKPHLVHNLTYFGDWSYNKAKTLLKLDFELMDKRFVEERIKTSEAVMKCNKYNCVIKQRVLFKEKLRGKYLTTLEHLVIINKRTSYNFAYINSVLYFLRLNRKNIVDYDFVFREVLLAKETLFPETRFVQKTLF